MASAIFKHALPFVAGMVVGVIFNSQIRDLWGMLRGAVPQVPDIPSFDGGGGTTEPAPVDETPAEAGYAYAYKTDFEKEYESHLETYNNGIQWS